MEFMNKDYLKYFPEYQPYPNQIAAMDTIQEALIKKQIVLFEGACGTGKTLSALAPSLHIAKQERKKIIIATNVGLQKAQFIEEAREIKKKAEIKIIVFKGKESTCPKGIDTDRCSDLIKKTYQLIKNNDDILELDIENDKNSKNGYCEYFLQILKDNNDDFRSWLFSDVRSSDEIEKWALKNNSCGYELLKRSMKEADVLICDYNHVLNESIRNNILKWLNTSLSNIILIFDEAHNIESRARSQSSSTLTEPQINIAIKEVEAYKDNQNVETFLRVLLDTIRSAYNLILDKKFGEREKVGNDWYDLSIDRPKERDDLFRLNLLKALDNAGIKKPDETIEHIRSFGLQIDAFYEKQFKEGKIPVKKICSSLISAIFLSDFMKLSNNRSYYPILGVKRQDTEIYGRLELLTCIPKNVTAPLFEAVHAAILMSATLSPFETIKAPLGITRETREMSFGLTFPKEKRLTIAVSVPPLFAKDRGNPATKEIITKVLNDIIEQSDGNVIIFFPSSFEATQYKNRLKHIVPIFLDEVGVSANPIRNEFFRLGESGKKAVLISYMRGTLTEGVDYKNGRGRTVVIVGVGYPASNDRNLAVQYAYDAEFGHGWDYAFEIPTIRKVRQALGRVVRSPDDYGARVLLDGRYMSTSAKRWGKDSVLKFFTEEERAEIIDVEPERVKYSLMNFFNNIRNQKIKPLIQEREMLEREKNHIIQHLEIVENDTEARNENLKLLDQELNKTENAIEQIKHQEFLMQYREQLRISIDQIKQKIEKTKNNTSSRNENVKLLDQELVKINPIIKANLIIYNNKLNQKIELLEPDNVTHEINLKSFGDELSKIKFTEKSIGNLEERMDLIQKKEDLLKNNVPKNDKSILKIDYYLKSLGPIKAMNDNELKDLINKKNSLVSKIEKEKEAIEGFSNLKMELSSNVAAINKINSDLSSSELQTLVKLNDNELKNLNEKKILIETRINNEKEAMEENKHQLLNFEAELSSNETAAVLTSSKININNNNNNNNMDIKLNEIKNRKNTILSNIKMEKDNMKKNNTKYLKNKLILINTSIQEIDDKIRHHRE